MTASKLGAVLIPVVVLGIAACVSDFAGIPGDQAGGDTTITNPPPPPPPAARRVAVIVIKQIGPDTLDAIGDIRAFSAEALDSAGNVVPGQTFVWSSEAGAVATTDPATGMTTATGNGMAVIRAQAGAISGTDTLIVWQNVDRLEVAPLELVLTLLQSADLQVRAFDDNDVPIARTLNFAWSSNRGSVTVTPDLGNSASARVTRYGGGTARITVSVEGESGIATVR